MKRSILILSTLFAFFYSSAQVQWVKNYDLARSLAAAQNKFIVMDFWAIWCGPCKQMDAEMWNNEVINDSKDNFIALKIDVDSNRDLAIQFQATTIPKVIILDPLGNIIWTETGFGNASQYLEVFSLLPVNPTANEYVLNELSGDGNYDSKMAVALSYQKIGRHIEHNSLKRGFLAVSNSFFKDAIKETGDEGLVMDAELNLVLNDAYRGSIKKALKKANKLNTDNEFKNFILAYCFKCEGQQAELDKYKSRIKDPNLLARLE